MTEISATRPQSTVAKAAAAPILLLSAFIGAFIVFGVGFAHPEALHNAAHDSRHALGFPCH